MTHHLNYCLLCHSDTVSQLSSQFCLRIPFAYVRASPYILCNLRTSQVSDVCSQAKVCLTVALLSMLYNPNRCLCHSAFVYARNIGRERGTASMSQWMSAGFLGTSSGGGPSESRNCSSLVLDIVGDGSLWSTHLSRRFHTTIDRLTGDLQFTVVDGAEGTLRQFSLQPEGSRVFQVAKVNKIFVTHMHREFSCYVPATKSPRSTTSRCSGPYHGHPHSSAQHPWLSSSRSAHFAWHSSKCLLRVSDRLAALTSPRHTAKGQSVRPSGPSHLPPRDPLADAHQNCRALRGPRAPHA